MAPPPAARDRLLDAFTTILIDHGERAATLEAVAAAAGVSKGGLLYHFGSKDALVDGLVAQLQELAAVDTATMRTAPEGAVEYYLTTSNYHNSPLDRAIVAMMRLSQGANAHAQQALLQVHHGWLAVLTDELGDPTAARMVALLGDGLYYNAALSGNAATPSPTEMNDLLAMVRAITRG